MLNPKDYHVTETYSHSEISVQLCHLEYHLRVHETTGGCKHKHMHTHRLQVKKCGRRPCETGIVLLGPMLPLPSLCGSWKVGHVHVPEAMTRSIPENRLNQLLAPKFKRHNPNKRQKIPEKSCHLVEVFLSHSPQAHPWS